MPVINEGGFAESTYHNGSAGPNAFFVAFSDAMHRNNPYDV